MNINPSVEFQDAFCALNNALEGVEGVATIFGREKSKYSIKCKEESNPEVLDKVAFTIVLDNCKNPMDAISIIFDKLCEKFEPLGEHGTEKKKKDYRQSPKGYTENDWIYRVHNYVGSKDGTYSFAKDNGYSSFHCGFRFNGTPIEIHIETEEMFMTNNFGSADHDKVHKSVSSIRDISKDYNVKEDDIAELESLIISLETLNDRNFINWYNENRELLSTNINPTPIGGKFTLKKKKKIPLLMEYLSKHNLKGDIFSQNNCIEEVMKVLNRYYLHKLIILYANGITDYASLIRACNNLKAHLPHGFPLRQSVIYYCDYLGIETDNKTTDELLIECIGDTNPILYRSNNGNSIPTNKDELSKEIRCYSNSVIEVIKGFFASLFQK